MSVEHLRGSVVRTAVSSGLAWERLTVTSDVAIMKPWLRRAITVHRDEIERVEFVRVRMPFIWQTIVRFRLANGAVLRQKFIPVRSTRARAAFQRCGWPLTEDKYRMGK